MLTSEHAGFKIEWAHEDGTPGRVDPGQELVFVFTPPTCGTISNLETKPDGRTDKSTTTTGFIEAGDPAAACACDVTGAADPDPNKIVPITLRANFTVEDAEAPVTSGTFVLDTPTPKAA